MMDVPYFDPDTELPVDDPSEDHDESHNPDVVPEDNVGGA